MQFDLEKYLKRKIEFFLGLPRHQRASKILGVTTFTSFCIISLICLSSIMATSQIITSMKLPDGYISMNLDIENTEYLYLYVPYEIKNEGGFDLTDIRIELVMRMNYINKTNLINITKEIFAKKVVLDDCQAFSTSQGLIEGDKSDFNITTLKTIDKEFDALKPIVFYMDLTFSIAYFCKLIQFTVSQNNLNPYGCIGC